MAKRRQRQPRQRRQVKFETGFIYAALAVVIVMLAAAVSYYAGYWR